MLTNNNGSSFYHSCLTVPVNPCSGYPCPLFERKYNTFITMNTQKGSSVSGSRPVSSRYSNSQQKLGNESQTSARHNDSDRPLKSLMEFYESIPDYGDMNHLSDEEFYRKLQHLKEKQKLYTDSLNRGFLEESVKDDSKPEVVTKEVSVADSNVCSDIHKGIVGVSCLDNRLKEKSGRASKLKNQLNTTSVDSNSISNSSVQSPKIISHKKQKKILEPSTSEDSTVESIDNTNPDKKNRENAGSELDESKLPIKSLVERNSILVNRAQKKRQKQLINLSRDSSSKSFRKPSQQMRASSGSLVDSVWDNFSIDDYSKSGHSFSDSDSIADLRCQDFPVPRQSKSVAWREPKITVPVPFPMTVREKENQQIQLLKSQFLESKRDSSPDEKKCFRANPVPITSRIPLFDKIMNDQENRRRKVKKQCIAELKSKMKPFSFVKRDEEDRRCLLSHSSPELYSMCKPIKMFKAKPVPKNLFGSLIYERMREDEYYRTLRKRIRSEELLRSSSLPPSMAAREKMSLNKEKFELEEVGKGKHRVCRKKRNRKIPNYKMSHEILQMELEGRKNENITTTPHPFHFETDCLHDRKSRRSESAKRCSRSSSYKAESISKEKERPVSAGTYVLHRDNLASVLRIQSSRERAELEKLRKREERKQREEARLRERDFRKNPAWKIVSGWSGVDEDLAIRACTRHEEERLQKQIHRHQMESMMSRVYQIPTLFERQSQVCIPQKVVREVQQKKSLKMPLGDKSSGKKSRKFSVRLLSKEETSLTPSPCDQIKTDYDVSYESDPEDDKTCRHSLGEDVGEGTGSEDEIKDEEEEAKEIDDNKEKDGGVKEFESMRQSQEEGMPEESKDDAVPKENGDAKDYETDKEVDEECDD